MKITLKKLLPFKTTKVMLRPSKAFQPPLCSDQCTLCWPQFAEFARSPRGIRASGGRRPFGDDGTCVAGWGDLVTIGIRRYYGRPYS